MFKYLLHEIPVVTRDAFNLLSLLVRHVSESRAKSAMTDFSEENEDVMSYTLFLKREMRT